MTEFFQDYFVMAIEASVVILIVLCIRPFFKRYSNRIASLLWLAVLFRLLCPYAMEGPVRAFWREWEENSVTATVEVANISNHGNESLQSQGVTQESNEATQSQGVTQESDEATQNQGVTQESSEATHNQGVTQESGVALQNQGVTQESNEATQNQGVTQESGEALQNQGLVQETGEAIQNQNVPQESGEAIQNQNVPQVSGETTQNQGLMQENGVATEKQGETDGRDALPADPNSVHAKIERTKTDIGRWMVNVRKWYHSASGKSLTNVYGVIWLFFAVLLTAWTITKYLKTMLKLREAVPNGEWDGIPVLKSDVPGVPMSFGIIRAKIFLPGNFASVFSDEQRDLILHHEGNHVKRHDPLWKLLAVLALCIHWWNPLVWLAYFLSAKDMEMACDEGVMNQIGDERRKEYANTLCTLPACKVASFCLPLLERAMRRRGSKMCFGTKSRP